MLNWNNDKTIHEILSAPLNLAIDNSDDSLVGQARSAAERAIQFCQQNSPISGTFTQKKNGFIFENCKLDHFGGVEAMIHGYIKIIPAEPIIRENLNITLSTLELNLSIQYLQGNEYIEGNKTTWMGRITTTTVRPHTSQRLITAQQASQIRFVHKTDQLVVYSQTRENRFATIVYTLTDFESANYITLDQDENKIKWLSTKGKLHVKNSPIGTYEVTFNNQEQPFTMDVHFPISGKFEIKDSSSQNSIIIFAQENAKNFDYQVITQGNSQNKVTKTWEDFLGWETETFSFI